jgi:hypothetical protein
VKYIGPSIRIEADDRCLFISLFLAYTDVNGLILHN